MSTTSDSTISPPEEDLEAAATFLKKDHPALGIAKLHALLLSENLSWPVGCERKASTTELEKLEPRWPPRTTNATTVTSRRGPSPSSSPLTTGRKAAHVYPLFTFVKGLDAFKWTTIIGVKYFDRKRGK